MIASTELDDLSHPRVALYLPRFRDLPEPEFSDEPRLEDFAAWTAFLRSRDGGADATAAMNVEVSTDDGTLATVASSLIAMPAYPGFDQRPRWWHADGAPDRVPFVAVGI
jgi:hypothetical protein